MIGLGLAVVVALAWDAWAVVDHRSTITGVVRSSTPAKVIVVVCALLLLGHLLVSETWAAEHDPIDKLEHRLHRWIDE